MQRRYPSEPDSERRRWRRTTAVVLRGPLRAALARCTGGGNVREEKDVEVEMDGVFCFEGCWCWAESGAFRPSWAKGIGAEQGFGESSAYAAEYWLGRRKMQGRWSGLQADAVCLSVGPGRGDIYKVDLTGRSKWSTDEMLDRRRFGYSASQSGAIADSREQVNVGVVTC